MITGRLINAIVGAFEAALSAKAGPLRNAVENRFFWHLR